MSASQRKNYFIAKDMQSKFAGTILLLALLVAVITACNIYVLGSFFVDNFFAYSNIHISEKGQKIDKIVLYLKKKGIDLLYGFY